MKTMSSDEQEDNEQDFESNLEERSAYYAILYDKLLQEFTAQNYQPQFIILSELMLFIFLQLPISKAVTLKRVCKHWFVLLSSEWYWDKQCQAIGAPLKPLWYNSFRWFIEMYLYGTFDPTILKTDIHYSSLNGIKNKVVRKLHHMTDISVALVGKPLSSGKIFAEFISRRMGDEVYVGVTSEPVEIASIKGSRIIKHKATWAYTDGTRFGIQAQGDTFDAEPFGTGDRVGLFLNIDQKQVSFYRNNQLQSKIFSLTDDPIWQIFVLLDYTDDQIEIVSLQFENLPLGIIGGETHLMPLAK